LKPPPVGFGDYSHLANFREEPAQRAGLPIAPVPPGVDNNTNIATPEGLTSNYHSNTCGDL